MRGNSAENKKALLTIEDRGEKGVARFEKAAVDARVVSAGAEGIQVHPDRTWHHEGFKRPIRVSYFRPALTILQFLSDNASIILSFWIGYTVWNNLGPVLAPSNFHFIPFNEYHFSLGVALVVCMIGFEVNGLYHPHRSILNIREFEVILKTCLVACGITLGFLFLSKVQFINRVVFAVTWSSILIIMLFQRYLFFRFQRFLSSHGFADTTAVIYGAGVVGKKLLDKFQQSPKLGYQVTGFVDDEPKLKEEVINGVPVLGGFSELSEIIIKSGAQKLFIALPNVPIKVVRDILNICRTTNCDFQIVPSLYDIVIQRVQLSEVDGIPLIGVSEPRYSFWKMVTKRIFDLIVASLLLVILSPLVAFFAVLIKATSKGPVLFKQKRIGKDGKRFVFFKFRSMYIDSPIYAETPHDSKDSRISPIGKFLRRTSLDELPQLINVIKGDMSLVGPRPEMPFIVSKYNELQRQRLNVRPGITGLWQISVDRKMAIHQNMDYDIYYINNQSLLMDIVILIRTVTSCIKGTGAY